MMHAGFRPYTIFLSLTLVVALWGCATVEFPPPSAYAREQFGDIALVSVPSEYTIDLDTPAKGKGAGALSGAGQGALGSLEFGAGACQGGGGELGGLVCVFGLALGIAFAPVAALIGAGVGASEAHSEGEVVEADANLQAALADVKPHEALRDQVIAAVGDHTDLKLVERPVAHYEANSQDLANEGPDTVLVIEVSTFYLTSEGTLDPDVTLVLGARAWLVRTADNAELYKRAWAYKSHEHGYFDLAADGALSLRTEIEDGIEKLADQMVFDLFLAKEPEVHKVGILPPGTIWSVENLSPVPAMETLPALPAAEAERGIGLAFAARVSAAECGNAFAQYYLGLMFKIGTEPAPEHPVAAYKWLSLAESGGHAEAKDARDHLAEQMTDTQIAEAERLVAEWEPDPAACEVESAGTSSYLEQRLPAPTARTMKPDTTGPMPKPELAVGDTWIGLKDGKDFQWTVISISGNAYTGRASDGCRWTAISWNFAPSYEFSNCKPYKDGKHKITSIAGKLWPLQVGNRISYAFTGSRTFGKTWSGRRTCEVKSREEPITTISGEHDTYKIICNDRWTRLTEYVSPKLQAVVYWERHRKRQNQTIKGELIEMQRAGSEAKPEVAPLAPSASSGLTRSAGRTEEIPAAERERVLANTQEFDEYLKGNIDELETALKRFVRKSNYGFDHEVISVEVQSYEFLDATAEEYRLRVRYISRGYWLSNRNAGEVNTREDELLLVRFDGKRIKVLKSLGTTLPG